MFNSSLIGLILDKIIYPCNANNLPRQMFKRSSGTPQAIGTAKLVLFPNSLKTMKTLMSNGGYLGIIVFPSSMQTFVTSDNGALLHVTSKAIPEGVIIICNAVTPPTIQRDITSGSDNVTAIYVPDESVTSYKTAAYWSAKASKIKGLSEYPGEVPTYPYRTCII